MRASRYQHGRRVMMVRAKRAVLLALQPIDLTDLETVQVMAEIQREMLSFMVKIEHEMSEPE